MIDIIAIGEPLMELSDIESDRGRVYLAGFGGDTSNFIIAAARQNVKTAYYSRIGTDAFGDRFIRLWKDEKVDISAVQRDETAHTGLYFITYDNGEHLFTYMRKGSAASKMTAADIPEAHIKNARLLHVSGISQAISDTACDAVFHAVSVAKQNGTAVSYDPNLRLKLWSLARARAIIEAILPMCDIYLPSYDEAVLLTGRNEPNEIVDHWHKCGCKKIVLKLGKKGVLVSDGETRTLVSGWSVDTVDQTGAGDTFDGAFCAEYLRTGDMIGAAVFGNAAAALSTTGYGAVAPIPRREAVEAFLAMQCK